MSSHPQANALLSPLFGRMPAIKAPSVDRPQNSVGFLRHNPLRQAPFPIGMEDHIPAKRNALSHNDAGILFRGDGVCPKPPPRFTLGRARHSSFSLQPSPHRPLLPSMRLRGYRNLPSLEHPLTIPIRLVTSSVSPSYPDSPKPLTPHHYAKTGSSTSTPPPSTSPAGTPKGTTNPL